MALTLVNTQEPLRQVINIRGELEERLLGYDDRNRDFMSIEMDGPHSYLPRHPEYQDKSQRLVSFTFWRHERIQDPSKLASYGFFYTGEGDLVRCFYCSIGLKDFIATDDPLLEHVRYSGNCPFLMEYLGPRRLAEMKEKLRPTAIPQIPQHKLSEQLGAQTRKPQKNPEPVAVTSASTQTKKYRHPQYESMNVRLASFTNWPKTHVQTPRQVAEAGFFYTGLRDVVRCFACDGGLQQWHPTDDPWMEHCRHFPFCPFARDTKGDVYIEQVKLFCQRQEDQEAVKGKVKPGSNSQPEDEVLTPMNKLSVEENLSETKTESRKETTRKPDMITEKSGWKGPEAECIIEMGFKISEVEAAVKQILQSDNKSITVDLILDTIENRAAKPNESLQNSVNAEEVIAEHLRLKSVLFCNLCKTKDTNALFLPCQHHRFCMDCSKQMTNCLYCGVKIEHIVKTFSS